MKIDSFGLSYVEKDFDTVKSLTNTLSKIQHVSGYVFSSDGTL